jgi:hypothetical protein
MMAEWAEEQAKINATIKATNDTIKNHKCYSAKQTNIVGVTNILWSYCGNGFVQPFIGLCLNRMIAICHLLYAGV